MPDSTRPPFYHSGDYDIDFGDHDYRGRKREFRDTWDVDGVRRALPTATTTTPHPINWRLIIGGLAIAAMLAVMAIILI